MSASFFVFVGAKGGTGTTTLCVKLAKALSGEGNVVLLDADLSGRRSVGILTDGLRYLDAVREGQPGYAYTRLNGISVGELVDSYESAFTLTPDDTERAASKLEQGIVLVDAPLPFSAQVRPFVRRATRMLIVAEPTVLGVTAARTMLDQLRRFGMPESRIAVVLCSRSYDGGISRAEAEKALGARVAAEVPPLDDRNFSKAVAALAREIAAVAPEPPIDTIGPSDNGRTRDRRASDRHSSAEGISTFNPPAQRVHTATSSDARDALKAKIHDALTRNIDLVDASTAQGDAAKMAELRAKVAEIAQAVLGESGFSGSAEDAAGIKEEIVNEALGLGPLEDFMHDPEITEIMVNGPGEIYVERAGIIHRTPKRFSSAAHVRLIIERIIAPLGRRIDESVPMVDARLPDGSRVNAVIEPISLGGPTLTIRRFGTRRLTAADLLEKGSASEEVLDFLRACIEARLNIVISGGTGSGKTTFLNILSSYLPERERIVTIEDAAELLLNQTHVVRMESRPANIEGKGQITIRDLVRNSLRMRPDRIVVGECRGAEALDMLQAMNTGHDGSLTTIHANAARDALSRIETMVLMAGFDLPVRAIREQISSAIDVVVQTARLRDGSRKVVSVSEIVGMEGEVVTMQDIVKFTQHGVDANNRVVGEFRYTGVQPMALRRFEEYGVNYNARSLSSMELAAALW